MRISAEKNSKYYDEKLVPRVSVYLDGKEVDEVVEVDDIEGWVACLKINEEGTPYLVYEDGRRVEKDRYKRAKEMVEGKIVYEDEPEEFVAKETLYGKVEIKIEKED